MLKKIKTLRKISYILMAAMVLVWPVISLLPMLTKAGSVPTITLNSGVNSPANGTSVTATATENTYPISFRTTATNVTPKDSLRTQVFYKTTGETAWHNFGTNAVTGPDGKSTIPNNITTVYSDKNGLNCTMGWGSTVKPASCNSIYKAANGTTGYPAFSGYPTYTPTIRLQPGNYIWKARAYADGVYGSYSAQWSFTILSNPAYVPPTMKTVVSLEFDDGLLSQATAQGILDKYNMKGTFYVTSGRVGQTSYLAKDQLLSMQATGHEIGGHTTNHLDLTTLTADQLTQQVSGDKNNLSAMGLNVSDFAYPFGSYNDAAINALKTAGYKSGRVVGGIQCNGCRSAESIPPLNAYTTETPSSIKNTTTLATMQSYVTNAEKAGGGWVQIVMHDVSNSNGSYTVSPATLDSFLSWLSPRLTQGTGVRTVRDVIGGAVTPPPPPPVIGTNLLKNPSLEADTNNDGAPDDWNLEGWGTSTYVYSRVNDAHDGIFAEKLQINSITTGDRKIVSEQDIDNVAAIPVAQPGKTYTISAWYKSNVPVALAFYYRNAAGSWVWFGESAPQPASADWKQITWVTSALPADAQYISAGIQIENIGWVIADDFKLIVN